MKTTIINKCIQEAVQKVKGKAKNKLQEPDYTAALAVEFPKLVNNQNIRGISVGGCFIHQSPYVNFDKDHKPCRCELGDLLVFVRRRKENLHHYNAALLQIKKTDHLPCKLSGSGDLTQLYLYESWPIFTSVQMGKYDIVPKTPHQGALYCVINTNSGGSELILISEPSKELLFFSQMTLAEFINNMMSWTCGRAISSWKKTNQDEWSKLIRDLLKHSAEYFFNRQNSRYQDTPRATLWKNAMGINEVDVFLQQMAITPLDDRSSNDTNGNNSINDSTGISTLFIDIDEEGFEKEEQDRI